MLLLNMQLSVPGCRCSLQLPPSLPANKPNPIVPRACLRRPHSSPPPPPPFYTNHRNTQAKQASMSYGSYGGGGGGGSRGGGGYVACLSPFPPSLPPCPLWSLRFHGPHIMSDMPFFVLPPHTHSRPFLTHSHPLSHSLAMAAAGAWTRSCLVSAESSCRVLLRRHHMNPFLNSQFSPTLSHFHSHAHSAFCSFSLPLSRSYGGGGGRYVLCLSLPISISI